MYPHHKSLPHNTRCYLAHWPFNGNMNDSTGRGHNASLFYYTTGTPPQVYRPGINGVAGSSFQFRSDFQMQTPYQPDLKLDSFTVAAVVNFDTLNAYSTILFGKYRFGEDNKTMKVQFVQRFWPPGFLQGGN